MQNLLCSRYDPLFLKTEIFEFPVMFLIVEFAGETREHIWTSFTNIIVVFNLKRIADKKIKSTTPI